MKKLARYSAYQAALWIVTASLGNVALAQNMPGASNPGTVSASHVQVEQAAAYMKANGFSAETIQGVLSIANFANERRVATGIAPEEEVVIRLVQPIKPDGSGLEQMLPGGNKLPKKSFLELTRQDKLTADNYSKVVDALFDPADMDVWLTKPDGSAMNAQERADQKEALVNSKSRWVNKYAELVKAEKLGIAEKWFLLFNTLVQKAIHGSREEFRRGLIAAHSISSYASIPQDKLHIYAQPVVTQAAELVLMREPNAKLILVERRFSPAGREKYTAKYLIASGAQLGTIGFPEGEAASQLALRTWHANQETQFSSNQKRAQIKGEIAQIKGEIAQIEGEIAQIEGETAQIEGEIAQIEGETAQIEGETAHMKRIGHLDRRFNSLAKEIMRQMDSVPTSKNNIGILKPLNKNFVELYSIRSELQYSHKQDGGNLVLRKNKELMEQLFSTLTDTAKIKGISLPKE